MTLLCTWRWASNPRLHILGAGYAQIIGHALSLFCLLVFFLCREKKSIPTPGNFP